MIQAQIFIDKDEIYQDKLLYNFIMEFLLHQDISGATAFNGFMGFGANQQLKQPNRLFSFDEEPMLITFIDDDAKVLKALKELRTLTKAGYIVTNPVEVH
ncbi:MAG: DUF190 domain-containing protein [Bacteroidetes bacterium]|nr:DUF190 domain-containing protein [Bacteroidota bacterium]